MDTNWPKWTQVDTNLQKCTQLGMNWKTSKGAQKSATPSISTSKQENIAENYQSNQPFVLRFVDNRKPSM